MEPQPAYPTTGFSNPLMTYMLNAKRDRFMSYIPLLIGFCAVIIACAFFVPSWDSLTGRVFGALIPLAVVILIFWRKKSLSRFTSAITVFPEGFCHSSNGQQVNVRWDDVTEVYQADTEHHALPKVPTYTTNRFTLYLANGQHLSFDLSSTRKFYKNYIEGLIRIIHRECTNRIFPKILKDYEAGLPVSFGEAISMNTKGIITKDEMMPWDAINAVQINHGLMAVQKEGKWLKKEIHIPVAKLANVQALLMLADYALKAKAAAR